MFPDGQLGILGARRLKPARLPQAARRESLVEFQSADRDTFHFCRLNVITWV